LTEVISVKFRGRGKLYYFDPAGVDAKPGDQLVVETSKGMELGTCIIGNHMVRDEATVQPLRPVVRAATENDLRVAEINRAREAEAFDICKEMIAKHKLEMKLVDVECSFEGNKILFFFTADGRVDFRELVKDLAGVFRTRIELRQIGVRDEAKMLGGLGICGRPFCCHQFLDDFQPVSTKIAKTQSMSLNPVKISGTCGRLMCCLRYEQEAYEDLVKHVPKTGAFVQTIDGYGTVTQVNLLRQSVKVRLDGPGDDVVRTYASDEFAEVPGGRPPEGEPLPQVLHYVAKPKEEPEPDEWDLPTMVADAPDQEEKPAEAAAPVKKSSGRSRRSRNKSKAASSQKAEKAEKPRAEAPKSPRKGGQPHAPQSGAPAEHAPPKKSSGRSRRRNQRPRNNGEGRSAGHESGK
jgi:cell fate regulator YaaT (PSP1 superfamily)